MPHCCGPNHGSSHNGKEKAILTVNGMTCNHCVMTVKKAVAALPSVTDVNVDLAGKKVSLSYDPKATSLENIRKAISDSGYDVV